MASILPTGHVQFADGRILYADTVINGKDYMELAELLPKLNPILGRAGMIGFPFGGGGGIGPAGPRGSQGPAGPINQIQNQGANLPVRSILNFQGNGVLAVDNPGAGRTDVTINDLFAATRIVSNDPTQGTDTTIQDAIDNCPAEGGDIYVKPGTYVMPAALTSKPGPITIRGSGVDVTILDFGAVAGKFISIDHDAPINLKNLTIYAGGLAGQYLYDVSTNYLGTEQITLESVMVGKFTDATKSIEGVFLGSALATLANCNFLLQNTVASWFADAGVATPGSSYIVCYNVYAAGTGVTRQKWGGFKNDVGLAAFQSLFGCANFGDLGFAFASEGTSFVGGGTTSTLNCSPFSIFTGVYINDVALVPSNDTAINACLSGVIYTLVDRIIDIVNGVDGIVISGCSLASWASEAIRNGGTHVTVSACGGFGADITVLEIGAADLNSYWNIDSASTIIGPSSRVNGVLRTDAFGGVTTNGFVAVVDHRNQKGVVGIGTAKNTGGVNTMDVQETVTDSFGTTASVITPVAPGTDIPLNTQVNKGTARPPYVSYLVEVRSTVPGSPTTYDISHATEGATL